MIVPVGRIDSTTVERFALALQNEIERGHWNLVSQLARVDDMSSAGIYAIMAAWQSTQVCGRCAACRCKQTNPQRFFDEWVIKDDKILRRGGGGDQQFREKGILIRR